MGEAERGCAPLTLRLKTLCPKCRLPALCGHTWLTGCQGLGVLQSTLTQQPVSAGMIPGGIRQLGPHVPIRSSKHPWHPVQGRAECVLGPSHDICRSALGGVCCSPHFTDGGTEAQRGESQAEVIEGAWGRAGLKPWPAESQAPVFNTIVTVAPTCGEGEKGWPVLAAGVGSLTRAQTCFPCPGLHSSIVQARARPRVLARPTCPLPPRRCSLPLRPLLPQAQPEFPSVTPDNCSNLSPHTARADLSERGLRSPHRTAEKPPMGPEAQSMEPKRPQV